MRKFGLRRALACLAIAGATAGVWAGAARISQLHTDATEAETIADEFAEENDVDADDYRIAAPTWTPPETSPADDDLSGRLQVGDFTVLSDADAARLDEMQTAFAAVRARSRYLDYDVDGDGTTELIWIAERSDGALETVIGAFHFEDDAATTLLWSPDQDADEIYLAGVDGLYYIRKNEWIITEYHCTEVLFDRYGEQYGGDTLSMYLVEDGEAYLKGVDAAMRRRMSFIDGRGVWYQTRMSGEAEEEARSIGASEWMSLYEARIGDAFAQNAPAYETLRTGIETGVARAFSETRRSRYAETPYTDRVYYLQLAQGDRIDVINRTLKEEAFALRFSDARDDGATTDPDGYRARLCDDARVSGKSEVSCNIISNQDDLISVEYRYVAADDEQETSPRLTLLTIEKPSGRQMQLGDLTQIDQVQEAVKKGYGEIFYPQGMDERFLPDADPAHDARWMDEALTRTRETSDKWKNVGLDEQYLYLCVITDEETKAEAALRVPRWRIGMSSVGHMELLTMHKAYPYLKETLDAAVDMKVRKRADGYEISYTTPSGGLVNARLSETDAFLPLQYSNEGALNFFDDKYQELTGFATGKVAPAGEGDEARFFLAETAYGGLGHFFLQIDDRAYEATQSGDGTREGMLTTGMTLAENERVTLYGEMKEDATGYAVWHDLDDDAWRLTRTIAENKRFSFLLTPKAQDGAGTLEVQIGPENLASLQIFEIAPKTKTFTFRDVNRDGFADLTIGAIDKDNHTDEFDFIYNARTNSYRMAPDELRAAKQYAYEAGTGNLVITDGDVQTLYFANAYGALEKARTLKIRQTEDAVEIEIAEAGDDEEDEPFLKMSCSTAEYARLAQPIRELFLSELAVEETSEDGATRILATRHIYDIVEPYVVSRLYVIDETGALIDVSDVETYLDETEEETVFPVNDTENDTETAPQEETPPPAAEAPDAPPVEVQLPEETPAEAPPAENEGGA